MSNKKKNDGCIRISTKVPAWMYELLLTLCKIRGMKIYELMQLLLHGFVSYAKADSTVPDEFRRLYDSLKFDEAYCNAFNFASPTARAEIAQMVLILQQHGHSGLGMMMIDQPYMGNTPESTTNVPDILERIIELSLGFQDYVRFRQMKKDLEVSTALDALKAMIAAQAIINLDEQNRQELPGMGNQNDYGRVIEYGHKLMQKKHRTPDTIQQRIVFEDTDKKAADNEANEWEGEHRQTEAPPKDINPFGIEW